MQHLHLVLGHTARSAKILGFVMQSVERLIQPHLVAVFDAFNFREWNKGSATTPDAMKIACSTP